MKTNSASTQSWIHERGPRRILSAFCLLASLLAASATTFTWTVGSRYDTNSLNDNNSWFNSLNWSPNGVPGAGDTANVASVPYGNPDPAGSLTLHRLQISAASVTVTSLTVDELALNAANLYGGAITFSGASANAWTWAGGTISGSVTFPSGLHADFTGPNAQVFSTGATLDNAGEIAWSGGALYFGWGAVLHNTGAFLASTDDILYKNTGGLPNPVFRNDGVLRKTAGSGTLTFRVDNGGVSLTNRGTVDIQSGTLSLPAPADFGPGGTLSGAGIISLDGIANIHGTSTLGANTTLRLTATLNANSGLDGTGMFEWRSGTLNGHLVLGAGVTLDLPGDLGKTVSPGASLTHHGLATLSGPGNLYLGWGANWNNHGTFEARTNGILFKHTGGSPDPAFNNFGTFRRLEAAGTVTFRVDNGGVRLNNAGTVEARSGLLSLQGGGANTNGLFQVSAGGQLDFGNGTHTFRDGARLQVGGLAKVNGATLTFFDTTNTITAGGELNLSAGTLGGTHTSNSHCDAVWE